MRSVGSRRATARGCRLFVRTATADSMVVVPTYCCRTKIVSKGWNTSVQAAPAMKPEIASTTTPRVSASILELCSGALAAGTRRRASAGDALAAPRRGSLGAQSCDFPVQTAHFRPRIGNQSGRFFRLPVLRASHGNDNPGATPRQPALTSPVIWHRGKGRGSRRRCAPLLAKRLQRRPSPRVGRARPKSAARQRCESTLCCHSAGLPSARRRINRQPWPSQEPTSKRGAS